MQKRILIIEDEKELAEMVKLRLSLEGYQCDIEYHTLQGTRAFCTGQYDLLVLDLMVPGGGGLAVLNQRAKKGLDDIPVIVVTGQSITPVLKSQLQQSGVSAIMNKPYDPVQFSSIIKRCINHSKGA